MSEPYNILSSESATPATLRKIAHARSMIGESNEHRNSGIQSLSQLFRIRAAQHPRKLWLTYYAETEAAQRYTYGKFEQQIRQLAGAMINGLGVEPGQRIATLMVNDPRTVMIYFASWLIGATVVPLNTGEDDERIAFILENSEAAACFCMADQAERLLGIAITLTHSPRCVQVGGEPIEGFDNFESLMDCVPLTDLPTCDADTEAMIVYTSGTTGAPKGVLLDHGNLLADARSIAEWHEFGQDDIAMNVLPLHHVNGIVVTLITPLVSGGSVVLNQRFRAHSFWKIVAQEKCTWGSVVPTVLAFLCELKEDPRATHDLAKLRHLICGAGPLTCDLARRFYDRYEVRVVHGYGLSETTCYSCFLPVQQTEAEYRRWLLDSGFPSIGCPIPANQMAIHDEQGNVLASETRGEIVVRGHNVMKYYFKRPEANETAFAHGWFRTGDEGFRQTGSDSRDYYFITGRIKELIIRGGVNISPFDIDEVLCRAPGVKTAMAVGFENDFYGEEVGAYVQLAEGASTDPDPILEFARQHLPYSKAPKVVVFGDTFPVTSTGKYQRNKLKPLFAEWKASEFRQKR